MVKHTQTIRFQFPDELFECVWSFCGVGAERVKVHFIEKPMVNAWQPCDILLIDCN